MINDLFFFLKVLKKLIEQLDQTKADKTTITNELDKVQQFLNLLCSL
jgi:hypothetical protein